MQVIQKRLRFLGELVEDDFFLMEREFLRKKFAGAAMLSHPLPPVIANIFMKAFEDEKSRSPRRNQRVGTYM